MDYSNITLLPWSSSSTVSRYHGRNEGRVVRRAVQRVQHRAHAGPVAADLGLGEHRGAGVREGQRRDGDGRRWRAAGRRGRRRRVWADNKNLDLRIHNISAVGVDEGGAIKTDVNAAGGDDAAGAAPALDLAQLPRAIRTRDTTH